MKNVSKEIGILLADKLSKASSKEEQTSVIKAFAELIVSKRLASKRAVILRSFSKEWNDKNNVVDVTVSAHSPEEAPDVKAMIEKMLGKKAEVTFKKDETLIGGSVIRIDDVVIDASVKNKLQNLRAKIAA